MYEYIFSKELRKSFLAIYEKLPHAWKKAFLAALVVNIFVFFFDLAQFPLGDHDVGYQDGVPLLSGGRSGRWFAPILYLLSGNVQIPVYTQILAFIGQIAAGMAAVLLWFPKAGAWLLFVGGVFVSCMPAVTEFYYYHWQAPTFSCAQLFMILALHISLRSNLRNVVKYGIAIGLCTSAMATYQSSIMTWTVCFWGYALTQCQNWNGTGTALRVFCRKALPTLASFLLAGGLYYISLQLYPLVGLSLELYQFQTTSLCELPARFLELAKMAWLHLLVPQGFMSLWLKLLLLACMACGAVCMLYQALHNERKWLRVCMIGSGILLFPLVAKSQFLLSASTEWYRYAFLALGLSYTYLFFVLILLASQVILARNVGFVLLLFLLPCMAINCLDQQVRHVRQVNHDMAILNRVIGRIEAHPNYQPDKRYNLVQLGSITPYLKNAPGMGVDNPLVKQTVSQTWNPGFELWLLSKYLLLGDRINEEVSTRPELMAKALEYVHGKAPFPAKDSIGIIGDTIILYFDRTAVPQAYLRLHELGSHPQKEKEVF